MVRARRQTDVTLCSADSLGVGGTVTGAGSTRSSRSRKMSHTAVGICKVAQNLVPGKLFMFVPHVFGAFAIESHHLLVDLGIDRSLVAFVVREIFALVLPRREPLVVCRPSLHGVGVFVGLARRWSALRGRGWGGKATEQATLLCEQWKCHVFGA